MAISNTLNIAYTALAAHQRAMDVIGHNIANESTEGYSRQKVRLTAATPLQTVHGPVGRGVTVGDLQRMRDKFVDQGLRDETSLQNRFGTLGEMMGRVEMLFNELSDIGISGGLDAFWNAWGDLANDPSGTGPRAALRSTATSLVNQFRGVSQGVDEIWSEVRWRLADEVDDANSHLASIADLNIRIKAGEAGGRTASDLRDQRDLLLDELAGAMGVTVHESGGVLRILGGGTVLLEGGDAYEVEVRAASGGGLAVGRVGEADNLSFNSGSIAGLSELSRVELAAVSDRLNQLVKTLVTEVNAIHVTGVDANGAPAHEFFDPNGLTAGSIDLSVDLKASDTAIVAGAIPGGGDSSLALAIAGLRENPHSALDGRSIGEFFADTAVELGLKIRENEIGRESQELLVSGLANRRASASSVSLDEEMIQLIGSQHAFAAATRLVSAADEMVREVLNMV